MGSENKQVSSGWHLPRWLKILSFHESESRKVGFGIWLFIVSNYFLEHGKIGETTWIKCAFVSGALIGFGSVVDRLIEQYAGRVIDKWSGQNANSGNPTGV